MLSPNCRRNLFLHLPVLFFVFFLSMLNTGKVYGQGVGVITGTVADPSGAALDKVTVTVTESETGFSRTATTDSLGIYVIPSLRPTQYQLSVEASGFKQFVQRGITLLADQTATVNVHLEMGSTQSSVTVEASAPLVDTTTNTVSEVIGRQRIVELPLNGRSAAQLMNLVPGATGTTPTVITNQVSLPGTISPSVNGTRTDQTSYKLDGANYLDEYLNRNLPFPFPDALQEFSVETQNYSARYGENAGAVVNVVTASGSRNLHGSLFEFLRNSAFNARNYFAPKVDPLHQNQFGGTASGPVILPHVYNGQDRTFFFFGYQGTRLSDIGTAANAFVPTTANLQGDFSALLNASDPANNFGRVVQINNPQTGQPYPGNIIPTSEFDPAAIAMTKLLPQVGGNGQVFFNKPTQQDIDEFIARVDHQLGTNDRLLGRFYTDRVSLKPQAAPFLAYSMGNNIPVKNVMMQETHTFRSNLLNQLSFQYSSVPAFQIAPDNSPSPAQFGVMGMWAPPQAFIGTISITGFFSINGGSPGPFYRSNYSFEDNLSWVLGRHNIDLGLSIEPSKLDLADAYEQQGLFGFTATGTNDALASFLLGNMTTFTQGAGEYKNNRNTFMSFYASDSFHIAPRLVLNFGLRYEPYSPWREIKGRVEQFRMDDFYAGNNSQEFVNAPPGLFFPGDQGVPKYGVNGSYNNIAPRIGFAYDVTGDGKTSIRSGFGVVYDTRTAGDINNRLADISPFSPQVSLTNPKGPFSNPVLGLANYPLPFTYPPKKDAIFTAPVLAVTFDPNSKYMVPATYEWNLIFERQIAQNWMLQTAYVGSHSLHQTETIQLNPATYVPGSKLGTDQRRMFLGYGSISQDGQDVNANYNALQVSLKQHATRNLSLAVAYTYSKSLDYVPIGAGANPSVGGGVASTLPWTYSNRHAFDYGPSDFDHTHNLVVSYVWKTPTLKNTKPFVHFVAGNWELNGIVNAQTGDPLSVISAVDQSMSGLNKDRGVLVPGMPTSAHGACSNGSRCVNWLNPQAFALPAVGTFGTLSKGSFRGPGLFTWDIGLFKNIPLNDGPLALQFRAEFFNVFNRANFSDPTVSVGSAAFGTITAAGDPRIGQLALKLLF